MSDESRAETATDNHHGGMSRRHLLGIGAMGAAGTLLAPPAIGSASASDGGRRLLLKGGIVLTLDRSVGDFDQADVLIEDGKIKTVARTVQPDGAQVIDCLVGVNLERLQRRAEGAREALLARSK